MQCRSDVGIVLLLLLLLLLMVVLLLLLLVLLLMVLLLLLMLLVLMLLLLVLLMLLLVLLLLIARVVIVIVIPTARWRAHLSMCLHVMLRVAAIAITSRKHGRIVCAAIAAIRRLMRRRRRFRAIRAHRVVFGFDRMATAALQMNATMRMLIVHQCGVQIIAAAVQPRRPHRRMIMMIVRHDARFARGVLFAVAVAVVVM